MIDPPFDALRNAIYHGERRTFLDRANRFFNVMIIILGAAAAGKLFHHLNIDFDYLDMSVVVLATFQTIFDIGGRARTHEFLQKQYYSLLAEIDLDEDLDVEAMKRKYGPKLMELYSEEPMTMRVLDALAYNKAWSSMATDEDEAVKKSLRVGPISTHLRNFWAFHNTIFQTVEKWQEGKQKS